MGFKLPKNLEQIANEHGLSKSQVEAFADENNITGIQQGSDSPSVTDAYVSRKRIKADKKRKKVNKEGGIRDKYNAAVAAGKDRRADRLKAKMKKKLRKAKDKDLDADKYDN